MDFMDIIPTVRMKDMYTKDGKTERDCYHFYCKCNRFDGELSYNIIGLYFDEHANDIDALVGYFGNDVDAAMDELDRLNQLLDEARKQIKN